MTSVRGNLRGRSGARSMRTVWPAEITASTDWLQSMHVCTGPAAFEALMAPWTS